jgi:hypothetical protein
MEWKWIKHPKEVSEVIAKVRERIEKEATEK